MARRSYAQHCGLSRALDVVGERWTLLVVRELLLGPRRYSDFLAELPGITTNLLAKRLRELEEAGIVARVEQTQKGSVTLYGLTRSGADLEPVIMELARWGGRLMGTLRRGDRVDIGWALLSMKRRYKGGVSLVAGVEVDGRFFELCLSEDSLQVTDREPQRPDVVLRGSFAGIRQLLFQEGDLRALVRTSAVRIEGSEAALDTFLGAFLPPRFAHLPRPLPTPA